MPLPDAVAWLMSLASCGVIEFVPKDDPTVKLMLRLRDILPHYTADNFLRAVSQTARITKRETITDSGRMLVWYEL